MTFPPLSNLLSLLPHLIQEKVNLYIWHNINKKLIKEYHTKISRDGDDSPSPITTVSWRINIYDFARILFIKGDASHFLNIYRHHHDYDAAKYYEDLETYIWRFTGRHVHTGIKRPEYR